jgi:stearoyl-CoA 9-desaturase NADPH oxidoreductase
MPTLTKAHRFLRSPVVDLLVGPHGIDRYLELIRPEFTVRDARAQVVAVRRQTARSVTLSLSPNSAWRGFRAGQFVRVGVEIDGVRRTRTYSPASSERADGLLELTVTVHPEGLVSRHLESAVRPGTIVHLGEAQGDFVLPAERPERLVLISGGSGITPVMSMLRTVRDEGFDGEIEFIHYARTTADWLYRSELEATPGVRSRFIATREGGERLTPDALDGIYDHAYAAVCGPPALLEAARTIFPPERLLTETFTPPTLTVSGEAATGTLRFNRSGRAAEIGVGTLLEQAEAAGLQPEVGCRMGICHTCTCRKTAGAVRDVRTGEVSDEEDEDIQLCVSVPAGDVALEI